MNTGEEKLVRTCAIRHLVGPFTRLQSQESDDIFNGFFQRGESRQREGFLKLVGRAHLFPGGAERCFGYALDMVRNADFHIFQL